MTLPEVTHNPDTGVTIVHPSNRNAVALKSLIVCTSFAVFDEWVSYINIKKGMEKIFKAFRFIHSDLLIADPTEEEEAQSLTKFTIAMDKEELCCVHKPGGNFILKLWIWFIIY